MNSTALIVVDVQNDFCEHGALPVTGGIEVAYGITEYLKSLASKDALVVFTKDWHDPLPSTNGGHFGDPPDFVDSWPPHCVQGTWGSQFPDPLSDWFRHNSRPIFYKGIGIPAYSGFEGRVKSGASLDTFLRANDVSDVMVVGLAADYCVRATALDAVKYGYATIVIPHLTAGIHRSGEDVAAEISHMQEAKA